MNTAAPPQTPFGAAGPADGMLDLGALWRAIVAHRAWIIGPTLLVLIGSILAVYLVTPRYTGEARVLLENRESFYTRPAGEIETGERFDPEAVQSQVQIMLSRDLAREVVKRLQLVGNSEFDSGAGIFGLFEKLLTTLGLARHPADRTPEDRVLEKYFDRLLVYPVARSRIVAIEFQSKDAELAARAANTVAAVYLEFQESAKKDTARGASSWLSAAIEPLRERVQQAEAKVEAYRAQHGLHVGTGTTTIVQSQLAELSQQMSSARSAQADAQAKARLIREAIRSGRTFEIPDVANNDLIRRLIEQRVNLRAQLALEGRTLLPEHPRMKELTAQIADLEGQIRGAAERTVRTLENEARIAGDRVETLAAAIDAQKQAASAASDSEVQLRALEREAKSERDQLEQFMIRYRDAMSRDAANAMPADARVISRAITPMTPSFPKKVPTVAVATLATFFVALALVISRELLSGRAYAPPQPVTPPADVPPEQPRGARRFTRAVRDYEDGEAAQAPSGDEVDAPEMSPERMARRARVAGLLTHAGRITHLSLSADDASGWAAHVLNLLGPGEGGAVTVLVGASARAGAARLFAQELAEDLRAVLVDLTAAPRASEPGLSELLTGDASFAEIIGVDDGSRLHLVGAGRAGREAVLAAPDLLELAVEALGDAYDLVLIEAGSADDAALLEGLMRHAGAAIVVADHVSNGHAIEAAYKLAQGHERPVAIAVFEEDEAAALPIDLDDRRQPAGF